jgi:hypothetical protein
MTILECISVALKVGSILGKKYREKAVETAYSALGAN